MDAPRTVTLGSGPPRFSLFIPIWFGDIHLLRDFDTGVVSLPGKTVSVILSEDHLLVIQIREFESNAAANICYEEIRTAISRAVAGRRASAHVAPLCEIERRDEPILDLFPRAVYEPWGPRTPETDGVVWKMRAYVLPDHERILLMDSRTTTLTRIVDPQVLSDWFISGERSRDEGLSDKEQLALALIAEANEQRNLRLEFLGLVNALEVLVEDKTLTAAQKGFVGHWKSDLEYAASEANQTNDNTLADELREIQGRLEFISDSIQNGIRRMLAGVPTLEVLNPGNNPGFTVIDDLPGAVKEVYSVRSELTHNGRVPDKGGRSGMERLRDAAAVARYVVYCALFERLQ